MLFPELGPQYYDDKHKAILSRMEAFYAESITINQSFWGEADTDLRFYTGDQTVWTDLYGNLPANRRRQFSFNRIMPIINMVGGYQKRNRKSTIVVPVENGDAETADQFTKVLMWINNQESVLDTISEAFHGALTQGMNLLQVWVDYRSDPISGNIKVDRCAYNSFLIDPYFRKRDLSDCNGLWKRTFLTKRECISLMPDHADEILGLIGNDSGTGRDGKFQFMPESYHYGHKNLLTYDEFYYRDFRLQKLLVDTETGETQEWRNQDNKEALDAFLEQYPQITVVEQEIPTVNLAIVIQGKVFYNGPNPLGIDQYPFVPVWAYYHPEMPYFPQRIQSMVRNLRDSQYLYNRRKVIELDILESQINSGFKYKENALVNPKDIFLSGQGRGLALKEDAQMSDVEQIIAPAIPASMIQLSEILAKEIQQISGVNEELLGSNNTDVAGILSALRQGSGLTTLQGLFDGLDYSQKLLGKLMIDLIQTTFTPGKVMKILEAEPSPQFYNKAFGRYDAVIEEGINTSTQKQMQFAQLLQLREVGVQIPDDVLLDACTVQEKKKLVDAIRKNQEQQQQAQQKQSEIEMQMRQAEIELARARTVADQGLGMERASRVEENKALAIERIAQAHKDEDMALLNLVKALKEIDSVDLDHIQKLLALEAISKQKHLNEDVESSPEKQVLNQGV